MIFTRLLTLLAALALLCAPLRAQSRVTNVEPLNAKPGATVSANGEGIDKANVDMVYLTDGKLDFKCEVVEQTEKAIKFKVPGDMKPGRWAVMIHTTKDQFLQQPVRLTVE